MLILSGDSIELSTSERMLGSIRAMDMRVVSGKILDFSREASRAFAKVMNETSSSSL